MAFGNFGNETKQHIGHDFTINKYENASSNYQKDSDIHKNFAVATLTFKSANPINYDDSVVTLVSTAGTGKAYQFLDDGVDTTGTIDSGAVVVQINGLGTRAAIMEEFQTAINHENGHNGGSANSVLSMSLAGGTSSNGIMVITQVVAGDAGNTNIDQIDVNVADFTVPVKFSGGFDGRQLDQVPFSLGISGIIPFNIGSSASESAYVASKGKTSSTGG